MALVKMSIAAAAALTLASVAAAQPAGRGQNPAPRYRSKITVYELASRSSRVVFVADQLIEAPNWSRDGKFLLVNSGGNLYRLPLEKPELEQIRLGDGSYRANNDHDLSPDGTRIAFSASTASAAGSRVYVCDADGSNVRLLTEASPSYFHGWSPDGKWLLYVARRGEANYEVYRVSVDGGPEQRLTSAGGYDDGPEYSPDGAWIYFNSNRGGGWNLWRIPPEGGGAGDGKAQQVTSDPLEDWFPHPSPDGKWVLFFSFPAGTAGHGSRMEGVALRILPAPGALVEPARIETLATFFGGQGTINVNSWSPDSAKFAYVAYELLPPLP